MLVVTGASGAPRSTGGAYVVPHATTTSETSNRTAATLFIIYLRLTTARASMFRRAAALTIARRAVGTHHPCVGTGNRLPGRR